MLDKRKMVDIDLKIVTRLLDELGEEAWAELHSNDCSRCEKPCKGAKCIIRQLVLSHLVDISRWN